MTQLQQLLVLDDCADDLEIFREVIKNLECNAFITDSYQSAAEFCAANKVHLLVSDLNVGADSGFELMKLAMNSPGSSVMRRIIYSTENPSNNFEMMEKYNVVGWIVKPAEYASLLQTLKNILNGMYHQNYINLKSRKIMEPHSCEGPLTRHTLSVLSGNSKNSS